MSPLLLNQPRIPAAPLDPLHSDYQLLHDIVCEIERRAGGWERFGKEVPRRLRLAIDEVIDAPRTFRLTFSQTEPTEKTYLGTKVEILIREFLDLPKGILDLEINGVDVDVKHTTRQASGWMIPQEAVGKACILVCEDESTALMGMGVIVCHESYLRSGKNQDKKVQIKAECRKHIYWILKDYPYPRNPFEGIDPATLRHIMEPKGGTERLARLFLAFPNAILSRNSVAAIAQQKDPMKRLRSNGGAREILEPMGWVILSSTFDKDLAQVFGHDLGDSEFVACPVRTAGQLRAVQASGRHLGVVAIAE